MQQQAPERAAPLEHNPPAGDTARVNREFEDDPCFY